MQISLVVQCLCLDRFYLIDNHIFTWFYLRNISSKKKKNKQKPTEEQKIEVGLNIDI